MLCLVSKFVIILRVPLNVHAWMVTNYRKMDTVVQVCEFQIVSIHLIFYALCLYLSVSLSLSPSLSLSDLSIDINECLAAALESANLCESDQNTQCVNNDGSYDCVCVPGYNRVNGSCQRKLHELFLS